MGQKASLNELREKLKLARKNAKLIENNLLVLEEKIKRLTSEKSDMEDDLSDMKHEVEIFQELIVVTLGLTEEQTKTRAAISHKKEQASRDDITIARQKQLSQEISALKKYLKNICPHSFVLEYDGHKGSSSHEYEDESCGERICAVCGSLENEPIPEERDYKVLTYTSARLVKRNLNNGPQKFTSNQFQDLDVPLDYILETFKESVGCMNLLWPKR